jgi:PPOX class probable F420-dependent enzyme
LTGRGLPDPSTPFGERVERRLRKEIVAWLTTVGRDGTPQPNLVWFLWEGESFLVYNLPHARRLEHLRARPRAALHFDSDREDADVVVFTGIARWPQDEPAAHDNPAYVAKYGEGMKRVSGSLEGFGARFNVPVRILPERVRGH